MVERLWVDADACQVTCPLHGWAFDLKSGAGVTKPARPVRSHPVRVVNGKVWVSVQQSAVSGQQAGSDVSGIAEPEQPVHLPPPTAES